MMHTHTYKHSLNGYDAHSESSDNTYRMWRLSQYYAACWGPLFATYQMCTDIHIMYDQTVLAQPHC